MLSSIINLIDFIRCLPSHATSQLLAERSQLEKYSDYSFVFICLPVEKYNFRRIKRWNNVWAAKLNCLRFFMAADYIRRCLRCSRLMRSDWLSWAAKQKKNNFYDTKLFYPQAAKMLSLLISWILFHIFPRDLEKWKIAEASRGSFVGLAREFVANIM